MAVDTIAIARRFTEEVWNKGNVEVIDELVSEPFVGHDPLAGELRGAQAFKGFVQMLRSAFPDVSFTIDDIEMGGDRVFFRWTARGTHRGNFMGLAPTNRKGEIRGMSVQRYAAGKVVQHDSFYDTLVLLQVMGVVPPLDQLLKAKSAQAASPRP